jgi:hypothetical protein
MIQDKEGYPANQQELLHHNRETERHLSFLSPTTLSLEDRRTLADCNVQEGTTLQVMMVRNQGR